MKTVLFTPTARRQWLYWKEKDLMKCQRIVKLLDAIRLDPMEGIGKPEKLKNQLQGFWSRRIDKEHRLVYRLRENQIEIISCRYHYEK